MWAFGICFVTGLLSHLIQHPPAWFWWPSRPAWLYRDTQGVHVATGLVTGPSGDLEPDLGALNAMPQHTAELPIACVEGWSATATWTGVRLRDLVARAGADPENASVLIESLERRGRYRTSVVPPTHTRDPLTLIALRLNSRTLHPDHGYPARLIAPSRPGVLQTKWVGHLTVREP